tara:strand:+ start:3608 stop:5062 length:1455 start_codon:yes stop_codon:yes gene_type:complete
MKRGYKKQCSILVAMMLLLAGCDKWTDIDQDPNAIVDGPLITEDVMLIGIEAEWTAMVAEKMETWTGFPMWLSWHSIEGSTPATMDINANYGNEVWDSYAISLKHAVELYDKAALNGNTHYQGIAGIIAAHHWFYIADVYDQAPLEDAMLGLEALQPSLASQEAIYAHANGLLDEAVSLLENSNLGDIVPGSDDYMLNGDVVKWVKFAYSLKARQAMRLSYAPGTTKLAQADLVLSYLANGMDSNEDNVAWKHLDELANANPLFEYMNRAYSGGLGLTPGNYLMDMMNEYNDPRRSVMFTNAEADPDGYVGHRAGAVVQPGQSPSHYRFTYLSMSYPDHIMLYSETRFLKAEAHVLKGEWAMAEEAMKQGARADMEYMGVDPAEIDAYLAQPALTMPTNEEDAQALIIEQKYLSNIFRTNETYFDFIRTGYPDFDFDYMLENVFNTETFPRRFPYPLNEVERNPNISSLGQPNWFEKGTTWDNK